EIDKQLAAEGLNRNSPLVDKAMLQELEDSALRTTRLFQIGYIGMGVVFLEPVVRTDLCGFRLICTMAFFPRRERHGRPIADRRVVAGDRTVVSRTCSIA